MPGRNKGLVLMLDTHSDQLSPGSVDSDFRGFSAVIGSSRSFPLMSQDGLPIRLGKVNKPGIVAYAVILQKGGWNLRTVGL